MHISLYDSRDCYFTFLDWLRKREKEESVVNERRGDHDKEKEIRDISGTTAIERKEVLSVWCGYAIQCILFVPHHRLISSLLCRFLVSSIPEHAKTLNHSLQIYISLEYVYVRIYTFTHTYIWIFLGVYILTYINSKIPFLSCSPHANISSEYISTTQ